MNGSMMASILGAVLILAGIGLVIYQMVMKARHQTSVMRSAHVEAGPFKFDFKTSFPGILIIGLGVLLVIVGAITGK
jgi:hypothetical protein